jgi:hypothetical protein
LLFIFLLRYEKHIESARKQGIKKGAVTGIIIGSMYFILFGSHALAFWYGNLLIQNEEYGIANVIFVSAEIDRLL